jgi:O-antigen ligase
VSTTHRGVLVEAALCVGPAVLAVALGDPVLGARWLFAALVACLCVNALFGHAPTPLVLVVATLPALLLLRGQVLYNAPSALLAASVVWLAVRAPVTRHALLRPTFVATTIAALAYWLVSWLQTGHYDVNFRIFELLGGVATIVSLAPRRRALATALFGMAGSLVAIGLALLPHGDRLGYADVGGMRLGNPIAFGMPLAFLLALTVADGGWWLALEHSRLARLGVGVGAAVLLVLSTSRAGWLVGAVSLTLLWVLDRRARRTLLVMLATLTVALAGVAQTSREPVLAVWVDRTFSTSRTFSNRTSGRSDQWMIFPAVMRDAPLWGFGPGSGGQVYAHYSALDPRVKLVPGEELPWHALYQHLAVETGVFGIFGIVLLLGTLLRASLAAWRTTREAMPLIGVVAFAVGSLTVSGMDVPSGFFLGFAFAVVGTGRRPPVALPQRDAGA